MLAEVLWNSGSSALQSWWYILEALFVMIIFQDVFFASLMYLKKPVSLDLVHVLLRALRISKRQIPIHGPSLVLGKWWSSLWFILGAPQLIMEGYKQVGRDFMV